MYATDAQVHHKHLLFRHHHTCIIGHLSTSYSIRLPQKGRLYNAIGETVLHPVSALGYMGVCYNLLGAYPVVNTRAPPRQAKTCNSGGSLPGKKKPGQPPSTIQNVNEL